MQENNISRNSKIVWFNKITLPAHYITTAKPYIRSRLYLLFHTDISKN